MGRDRNNLEVGACKHHYRLPRAADVRQEFSMPRIFEAAPSIRIRLLMGFVQIAPTSPRIAICAANLIVSMVA